MCGNGFNGLKPLDRSRADDDDDFPSTEAERPGGSGLNEQMSVRSRSKKRNTQKENQKGGEAENVANGSASGLLNCHEVFG